MRPSKLTIIGSDNDLSPGWSRTIIWTNTGMLLIRTAGTNLSEILREIYTCSFKKMHLKLSSANYRLFCPDRSVLMVEDLGAPPVWALLPLGDFIALWWWFCPCRVGGAVWNHTAWLFPLMPLPTLSLFYSYFLSGNKYRKNITCKNIGQFQFCINLLPLELIWRSASCPRHWNQRWFGDAAFTIPSGKQWDHMSPWPPSWLSAGIDECCRSANESGHQWLKNSWLETIWH